MLVRVIVASQALLGAGKDTMASASARHFLRLFVRSERIYQDLTLATEQRGGERRVRTSASKCVGQPTENTNHQRRISPKEQAGLWRAAVGGYCHPTRAHTHTQEEAGFAQGFAVREWVDIDIGSEFRAFVHNNRLNAMCQVCACARSNFRGFSEWFAATHR